jgi:hypothetical protein
MKWHGWAAVVGLIAVIALVVACGGGGGGGGGNATVTISGTLDDGAGKPGAVEGGLPSYASAFEGFTVAAVGTDGETYTDAADSNGEFSVSVPAGNSYILSLLDGDGDFVASLIFDVGAGSGNLLELATAGALELGSITVSGNVASLADESVIADYIEDVTLSDEDADGVPDGLDDDYVPGDGLDGNDYDNDGVANNQDIDRDGDGIPNVYDDDDNNDGVAEEEDPVDPDATDTTAPTVVITSPTEGATVSGDVTVSGTASDDVAVFRVLVSVNGGEEEWATGTSEWTCRVSGFDESGQYTISVRARDAAGNVSDTVSVTVNVAAGWYALGQVTDTEASQAAIASDGTTLVVFYRYYRASLDIDEGILKKWYGPSWSTQASLTNECHDPDVAILGDLGAASWYDDGWDGEFATNANGPWVTMGLGGLVNHYGMTVAVTKGRAYVTYASRHSDGMPANYMMLHIKSPVGTTGEQDELDGGWSVPLADVGTDPAITGDTSHSYTVFQQQGWLYVMRDTDDFGPAFRVNSQPSDPEIVMYQGVPTVVWTENAGVNLYVAQWNGVDNWVLLGHGVADTGYYHSVRVAASGDDLYVAYEHVTTPSTIVVEHYDGTEWSAFEDQLEEGTGNIATVDIAVHGGQPVVCFVEAKELKVLKYRP